MRRIISLLPLIPIRKEPSHRSEMTSQLLFGEKALFLNEADEWVEIKTEFDNYIGWIELKSVEPFELNTDHNIWGTLPLPLLSITKENYEMIIPAGSELPSTDKMGCFEINNIFFKHELSTLTNAVKQNNNIAAIALKFINAPYLWGGRSILGIDCSGFIQVIFKIKGIALPRDAKDQSEVGNKIESVEKSEIGDLFFFNNEAGYIIHVGMLIEPGKIIHSSGSVRIDSIDNKGIFRQKTGKYTHLLKMIKRLDIE